MRTLDENIESREIKEIILFAETQKGLEDISVSKVTILPCKHRPTFNALFKYANAKDPLGCFVIANNDISFKEFQVFDIQDGIIYPCSRYEIDHGNIIWYDDYHGPGKHERSQDAWFFRGNADVKGGYFTMGQPRCDTRLAWLLHMNGYHLENKGKMARLVHMHKNVNRNYAYGPLPSPLVYCNINTNNSINFHPIAHWNRRKLAPQISIWDLTRSLFSSRIEFYFIFIFYSKKLYGKLENTIKSTVNSWRFRLPIINVHLANARLKAKLASDESGLFLSLHHLFKERTEWVFFDIGANNASSSVEYCSCFLNASGFLFEAHPAIAKIAGQSVKTNGVNKRCSVHAFAASNENSTATFYVSSLPQKGDWRKYFSHSSAILPPKEVVNVYNQIQWKTEIEVATVRLDTLISDGKIPIPQFIHMDIQGAEKIALEGLGVYLKHVEAVWLEVSQVELYEGQCLAKDIDALLTANGFKKTIDDVGEVYGAQLWVST